MRLFDMDSKEDYLLDGKYKVATPYAPLVNVVEVVRCKDCKWYVRSIIKQDGTLDKRYKPDWCDLYGRVRKETYFCANGERRDDELQEDDGRCELPCAE